ncbi:hypothetical protein [Dyella acidisoli]|uniref:Opioid growth factor receptor (OGFr) conserved domain-containing protein n=2 Tax=Dyella acidisoli TaxID=1867834 RepID=A0ABQ5XMJ2_9GAMM|nr:hypothetical protein GCM10007901_17290 [Dyella acidisoli]
MMRCDVDNEQFDPGHLIYRDQGYGADPERPLSQFSLVVTDDELLSTFLEPFSVFMSQCKEDDESFSESDIPELKTLGYPSLEGMLSSHRRLLAGLLKDFLYFQLLDALIGKNPRSGWRFAINEIAEVSDEEMGYLLQGKGYFIG